MAGQSYLSAADAAQINQERLNALATRIALQDPQVSLVLYRLNEGSGAYDPLPAQTVLLRYFSRRQAEERRSDGAVAQYSSGSFAKEEPFDVQVGDAFALPNGQSGAIDTVAMVRGGIARATWTVDVGAPA